MSLKTIKKRQVHNYDSLMRSVNRQIRIELSGNNSELISKYDREMVRQSIAVATRQKHLRTLLGLTRLLKKDWKDATKDDMDELVYEIMQSHQMNLFLTFSSIGFHFFPMTFQKRTPLFQQMFQSQTTRQRIVVYDG